MSFSVVGYSQPYTFGRLKCVASILTLCVTDLSSNSADIVTLLSALGISNEVLLNKQRQHFETISKATADLDSAILLLSTNNISKVVQTLDFENEDAGRLRLVEDLIVKGLENKEIQRKLRKVQDAEMSAAVNKRGEEKVRAIIRESRLLYGVCDDEETLKEGEVFVRIEVPKVVSSMSYLYVSQ